MILGYRMLFLEFDIIQTLPVFPDSSHVFSKTGSSLSMRSVPHRTHGLRLKTDIRANSQLCEAGRALTIWIRMVGSRRGRSGS